MLTKIERNNINLINLKNQVKVILLIFARSFLYPLTSPLYRLIRQCLNASQANSTSQSNPHSNQTTYLLILRIYQKHFPHNITIKQQKKNITNESAMVKTSILTNRMNIPKHLLIIRPITANHNFTSENPLSLHRRFNLKTQSSLYQLHNSNIEV